MPKVCIIILQMQQSWLAARSTPRTGNLIWSTAQHVIVTSLALATGRLCTGSIPGAGHLFWYVTSNQRPTQPSIPPGSVNEYQLRLGRQRQVWFIPLADAHGMCR